MPLSARVSQCSAFADAHFSGSDRDLLIPDWLFGASTNATSPSGMEAFETNTPQ